MGAAGLAIDLHAVFKVVPAAEPARWGPALGFLGGIGDPTRAAPGADQERRPALAASPGRQRAAGDRLPLPLPIPDFDVGCTCAAPLLLIVAEQREPVSWC